MTRALVGPHAGETSSATLELRDRPPLDVAQRRKARQLRRLGVDMQAIADELNVSLLSVSYALANLRTPRPDPPRASLNVSLASLDYVRARQRPGEAIWKTVNRLFGIA